MKRLAGSAAFVLGAAAALAAGWVAFPLVLYTNEPQPIAFSHAAHGEAGAGMSCEDCHAILESGRFTGVPGVASCAECHAEPIGGSAEEKRLVEEFVTPVVEIPWRVYSRQPDHVFFSHATHVKLAGLNCSDCHGAHGESAAPPVYAGNRLTGYGESHGGFAWALASRTALRARQMTDCSNCHFEAGVRASCLDCHK